MRDNSGQVLLVVVLIAVIALTIGLSLVSRSITGVRVATQSEESQRAFQAAEAGVERTLNAIRLSPTPPTTLSDTFDENQSTYETVVEVVGNDNEFVLNGGNFVEQDVGGDLWLSEYPDYTNPMTDTIQVHFGTDGQTECVGSGEGVRPAIEILALSGDPSSPTLSKHVVDPCGRIDGASDVNGSGGSFGGVNFQYFYEFGIQDGLVARVVPIYNSSVVGVSASGNFSSQGSLVESIGKSGESVRKLQVYESHPQIPIEIFQYAILSQ